MTMSIKTPIYNLEAEDLSNIYPPSEDTFLLIDAFEKDLSEIKNLVPAVCLEVGVGTGIVITSLGTVLGKGCKYFGTDINPFACKKASETALLNDVELNTFCCNLVSNVPAEVIGAIDILIFNPPYVVTESAEINSGLLHRSWAGGKKGREVMDELFPLLRNLLSNKGVFYLVLEERNEPEDVIKVFFNLGFSHECVIKRKVRSEQLYVMKFKLKL